MADDTLTHPETALTAEGAKYWLRSYHWSHVEAAYLLHGHDPRSVAAGGDLLAIVADTLAEIARTSGPRAVASTASPNVRPRHPTYACDQWPPAKWLEAWRIAGRPIPAVLSEAEANPEAATDLRLVEALDENARLHRELAAAREEPDPRHRRTLLRIIGALAKLAEIDANNVKRGAEEINAKLEGMGQKPLDWKTVARVIQDALQASNAARE